MTDTRELTDIIRNCGGELPFDDIISEYQKKHHMIVLAEHRAVIKAVLENSSELEYDNERSVWKIISVFQPEEPLDITIDHFGRLFDLNENNHRTAAYKSYLNGARKIWEEFASVPGFKIDVYKPSHVRKGTIGGVKVDYRGKHIADIPIGLSASIYAADDNMEDTAKGEFEYDPVSKRYRIRNTTPEHCIEIIKKYLGMREGRIR